MTVLVIFWIGFVCNFLAAAIWMSLMKKYNDYSFGAKIVPWAIAVILFFVHLFMVMPFCNNCFQFFPILTGKLRYDWDLQNKEKKENGITNYFGDRSSTRVCWASVLFAVILILDVANFGVAVAQRVFEVDYAQINGLNGWW